MTSKYFTKTLENLFENTYDQCSAGHQPETYFKYSAGLQPRTYFIRSLIFQDFSYTLGTPVNMGFVNCSSDCSHCKKVFCKSVLLKICWSVFFNKVSGLDLQLYKRQTPTQCFPVKFAKFLRTPFLKNICERLLLNTEAAF